MNCALRGNTGVTSDLSPESSQDNSGVVALHDTCFDDTVVDLSDCEQVTFTQVDEDGRTHTVILSARHIAQLSPHMDQWKHKHTPNLVLLRNSPN